MTSEQKRRSVEASERWRDKNREREKAARKDHYQRNKERLVAEAKMHRRRKLYGMTPDEYDAFVARPCEVCGSRERVCVDHDHATGIVRGPLCVKCNAALGQVGDDIDRLLDLANYLKQHGQ